MWERLLNFIDNLRTRTVWDRYGKLRYLREREPNLEACCIDNIPSSTVAGFLTVICDAFGIPESQTFCLRPTDRITDIYAAMTTWLSDGLELEILLIKVQEKIKRPVTEAEQEKLQTIEDLIRFLQTNTVK